MIGLLELAGVTGVLAGLRWLPLGIGDTAPSVIGLGLAVTTAVLHFL